MEKQGVKEDSNRGETGEKCQERDSGGAIAPEFDRLGILSGGIISRVSGVMGELAQLGAIRDAKVLTDRLEINKALLTLQTS
jgi:hypothetical protein